MFQRDDFWLELWGGLSFLCLMSGIQCPLRHHVWLTRWYRIGYPKYHRGKKDSRLSQMGDTLKAWVEASKARNETSRAKTEAFLAKAERYKNRTTSEATSTGINDFSITKCMTTLQTINLLDNDKYLNVVDKFTYPDWREIFYEYAWWEERGMAW